jgi:hypothetical protein
VSNVSLKIIPPKYLYVSKRNEKRKLETLTLLEYKSLFYQPGTEEWNRSLFVSYNIIFLVAT